MPRTRANRLLWQPTTPGIGPIAASGLAATVPDALTRAAWQSGAAPDKPHVLRKPSLVLYSTESIANRRKPSKGAYRAHWKQTDRTLRFGRCFFSRRSSRQRHFAPTGLWRRVIALDDRRGTAGGSAAGPATIRHLLPSFGRMLLSCCCGRHTIQIRNR